MSFIALVAGVALGLAIGYLLRRYQDERGLQGAGSQAQKLVKDAIAEGEARKKELLSEGKEEVNRLKTEADREIRERKAELQRQERRLEQKDENLDRKLESLSRKEEELRAKQEEAQRKVEEIEVLKLKQMERLEEVAALTREEARELLLKEVEEEAGHLIGLRLKDLEEKAKRESERKAREYITTAIQRCAVEQTSEIAVSVVSLPSDEMKGRIIGREGRNIRTFETMTGVDLIVDDTPEAVALSSFDPVRREVARLSLERLVVDGRIHPARIEEVVDKARKDVE